MDREDIIAALERKVDQQGGMMHNGGYGITDYEEIDPNLTNPYKDDGSMEFKKLRIAVMKKMASDLFGATTIEALAALHKSDIDKEMAKLAKAADIELRKAKEDLRKKKAVFDKTDRQRKVQEEYAKVKVFDVDAEETAYTQKNPYVTKLAEDVDVKAQRKKVEPDLYKFDELAQPPKKLILAKGRKPGRPKKSAK